MDENYQMFNPYFNPNWKPSYQNTYNPNIDFSQLTKYGVPKPKFNTTSTSVPKDTADIANDGGMDKFGSITQGVTGAIDLGADIASMDDEAKAIQTKAPTAQYDAFGKPVYNLGGYSAYVNKIKPRGASGGEVLSGVGKGASAGAAIGSTIPVVGTAIGAVAGGLIGGLGKVFGGGKRKKEMEKRRKKALKSIAQRQKKYNRDVVGHTQQRQAMNTYYDQINNTNRMYNLYGGTY